MRGQWCRVEGRPGGGRGVDDGGKGEGQTQKGKGEEVIMERRGKKKVKEEGWMKFCKIPRCSTG